MSPAVEALQRRELEAGLNRLDAYATFAERVKETKRTLLDFLIQAKRAGKTLVGYGAPGKGNTLLNYCGIRQDFLDYTVDRSPYKQGKFTPGTRIPILPPETHRADPAGLRPDPSLEPEGRDRAPDEPCTRMGRPVRRSHPHGERRLVP